MGLFCSKEEKQSSSQVALGEMSENQSSNSNPIDVTQAKCAEEATIAKTTEVELEVADDKQEVVLSALADEVVLNEPANENPEIKLVLVPHVHTLFCERKQRICSSIGKTQELEWLSLEVDSEYGHDVEEWKWYRRKGDEEEEIVMEPSITYQLSKEDIGCYIFIKYFVEEENNEAHEDHNKLEEVSHDLSPAVTTTTAIDQNINTSVNNNGEENNNNVQSDNIHSKEDINNCGNSDNNDGSEAKVGSGDIEHTANNSTDCVVNNRSDEISSTNVSEAPQLGDVVVGGSVAENNCNDVIANSESADHLETVKSDGESAHQEREAVSAPVPASTITAAAAASTTDNVSSGRTMKSTNIVGPVLASPPRLLELTVRIEDGAALAESKYIGGYEGESVYWWMRIRDGVREQLGEEQKLATENHAAIARDGTDPRCHRLTAEDNNCVLKVKCKPVRSDGAIGEIFTSKASEIIQFP